MAPPAALDVDTNGNGVPKRLTVDGIAGVRAQSAKMPAGVAPATSSDEFKSPVSFGMTCATAAAVVRRSLIRRVCAMTGLLHQT
jgi:aromatic amino acid aminotransferase I